MQPYGVLLATLLSCASIYTSYAFAAQILIYPLIHERFYAEHQERSFKAYGAFIMIEFAVSIVLTFYSKELIVAMILLLLTYIPMILLFRLEARFADHVINEDYDWFRRYGWLRCLLCFVHWAYIYGLSLDQ